MFDWRNEKNDWLKEHRGVCFEQVVLLFEREEVLDILEHPNQRAYPNQEIAVVLIDDCAYLVPFEEEGDRTVLKTIIPSRRATSRHKGS